MCFSFSLLPPPPRLPAERQQGPSPFYPQLSASRGAANFSADDILAAIPPLPPLSLSPAEISPSPLAPAQHHADHHHHLHLHHHQHHHLARENSEDESELSSTVLISEVSHRHSCEHDEEDDDVEIKCKRTLGRGEERREERRGEEGRDQQQTVNERTHHKQALYSGVETRQHERETRRRKDESLIGLPALQLHNKLETSAGHLSLHMSHRGQACASCRLLTSVSVAFTGSPLVPPRRVRLFRRDLQNMQENSKDNSEDNSKENQKDNSNNKSKDSSEDSSDKNSNQSSNANGSNIRDIMAMIESEADSENAVIKRSEDAGNEKLSSNTFARCEDVRMRQRKENESKTVKARYHLRPVMGHDDNDDDDDSDDNDDEKEEEEEGGRGEYNNDDHALMSMMETLKSADAKEVVRNVHDINNVVTGMCLYAAKCSSQRKAT
eukprot:28359-Hanusia_phi.AAC.1